MNFRFWISDFRFRILVLALGCLFLSPSVWSQSDSALNRSVTVERAFQPVIQAAGKVATKPSIVETTIEPAPVEYSDYSADVHPEAQFNPLLSQPTRFEPGRIYNGYVRGALGHPNTLFDFGYHLDDGKKSILDVYAHHKADWGLATLSKTTLGLNFTHPFSTCDLYFGVNGGNIYYQKYGRWYDYSYAPSHSNHDFGMWEKNKVAYLPHSAGGTDITSLWFTEVMVGIKANAKQDFQYRLQTGYMLFANPGAVAEHQIRTHASFDWHADAHHVGTVVYVQNNFMSLNSLASAIPDSLYNSRHNIRLEPYYAFKGKRVNLHIGINLDMNIGRGQNSLSGVKNLSFAPSPHINLEAQVAKQWMTIYMDVTGNHGMGTLQSFMESNRYRTIHAGIISHHVSSYTPVDGEIGFHIRPYRDLLIEIHGGYAYMLDQMTLIATTDSARYLPVNIDLPAGDFSYTYSNYGRGKVGGQLIYHLQDALRINVYGDYYFWSAFHHEHNRYGYSSGCDPIVAAVLNDSVHHVYDRANWEVGVRIDGRIDRHWSLYSDNYFAGSRLALTTQGEKTLRPTVELNLGLQYDMWVGKDKGESLKLRTENRKGKEENGKGSVEGQILKPEAKPNLSFFFQLNNWLHRKNDIYYGYRSQGIHFLLGGTYRF